MRLPGMPTVMKLWMLVKMSSLCPYIKMRPAVRFISIRFLHHNIPQQAVTGQHYWDSLGTWIKVVFQLPMNCHILTCNMDFGAIYDLIAFLYGFVSNRKVLIKYVDSMFITGANSITMHKKDVPSECNMLLSTQLRATPASKQSLTTNTLLGGTPINRRSGDVSASAVVIPVLMSVPVGIGTWYCSPVARIR